MSIRTGKQQPAGDDVLAVAAGTEAKVVSWGLLAAARQPHPESAWHLDMHKASIDVREDTVYYLAYLRRLLMDAVAASKPFSPAASAPVPRHGSHITGPMASFSASCLGFRGTAMLPSGHEVRFVAEKAMLVNGAVG